MSESPIDSFPTGPVVQFSIDGRTVRAVRGDNPRRRRYALEGLPRPTRVQLWNGSPADHPNGTDGRSRGDDGARLAAIAGDLAESEMEIGDAFSFRVAGAQDDEVLVRLLSPRLVRLGHDVVHKQGRWFEAFPPDEHFRALASRKGVLDGARVWVDYLAAPGGIWVHHRADTYIKFAERFKHFAPPGVKIGFSGICPVNGRKRWSEMNNPSRRPGGEVFVDYLNGLQAAIPVDFVVLRCPWLVMPVGMETIDDWRGFVNTCIADARRWFPGKSVYIWTSLSQTDPMNLAFERPLAHDRAEAMTAHLIDLFEARVIRGVIQYYPGTPELHDTWDRSNPNHEFLSRLLTRLHEARR